MSTSETPVANEEPITEKAKPEARPSKVFYLPKGFTLAQCSDGEQFTWIPLEGARAAVIAPPSSVVHDKHLCFLSFDDMRFLAKYWGVPYMDAFKRVDKVQQEEVSEEEAERYGNSHPTAFFSEELICRNLNAPKLNQQ